MKRKRGHTREKERRKQKGNEGYQSSRISNVALFHSVYFYFVIYELNKCDGGRRRKRDEKEERSQKRERGRREQKGSDVSFRLFLLVFINLASAMERVKKEMKRTREHKRDEE